MKKAAIYGRCASIDGAEQAIERQVNACAEYAKNNGIEIVGEYIDKAMSGINANRPAFLRIIEDAAKGTFDCIIVYRLDRFSRDMADGAQYRQTLKQYGVSLVSVTESDPNGSITELLFNTAELYTAEGK